MWTDKLKSSLEKLNFWFFSSSFFTTDFKICLYARWFDTSHCPHDIFWLHFANSSKLWENKMCQWTSFKFSVIKLFSQSFGELASCSQNVSCGQCEVSKHLVHRHILQSIMKKLEEKNQKFSFFGIWINFNQVCSSHAICLAAHPWIKWCKVPEGGFDRQYEKQRVNVTVNKTNQKSRQNLLMFSRGQLCFHASRLHDILLTDMVFSICTKK